MASSSQPDAVAGAPTTQIATAVERPHEMSNIPPTPGDQQFEDALQQQQPETPRAAASSSAAPPQLPPGEQNTQIPSIVIAEAPPLTRQETEALGPATEESLAQASKSDGALNITLMLTTGARHPYKIDEKYLRSRQMELGRKATLDPKELSGYQLKELIWIDWRSEWEPRPANPSSIRLIILGRMIESKATLRDLPFKDDATNVVHMTVKPADLIEDEEPAGKNAGKNGAARMQDGEDRGAGCRCVIQ